MKNKKINNNFKAGFGGSFSTICHLLFAIFDSFVFIKKCFISAICYLPSAISKVVVVSVICYLSSAICSYAAFKDNGWGGRGSGLGGAFTAIANDASATSWNPAGITQLKRVEMALMYEKLFMGLDEVNLGTGYASLVIPTRTNWSYGLSWENFISKDQYSENSIKLSVAAELQEVLRLIPELSVGINFKFLENKFILDEYNRNNPVFDGGDGNSKFTADIGVLLRYVPYYRGVSMGLAVKNITQPDVGLVKEDIVPMEFHFGLAAYLGDLMIGRSLLFENVTPSLEMSLREDDFNFHMGWESWFYGKTFGLRLGGNLKELTSGGSYINHKIGCEIDYSFRLPLELQGSYGSHRLGLIFRFGREMK